MVPVLDYTVGIADLGKGVAEVTVFAAIVAVEDGGGATGIYCRAATHERIGRRVDRAKESGVPTVSSEQLLERLAWRYATKKFDPSRRIPPEVWSALEQSMVLTPSSFGLQPWKFIVVNDVAVRASLRAKAWNQPQMTDASHVVVFARRTSMDRPYVQRFIDRMADVRNMPSANLNGYRDMMLGFIEKAGPGFDDMWNARQVYIALGFFLSACAMVGVDACPIEGFEPAAFDQILDLRKDGYAATVVAAAGYRASDDASGSAPKVRFATEELIEYR